MIKTLHIAGFQCHRGTLIDLDRITVLTGDNDAGKSAVIRSLLWLALNEWDGKADDFIHWDMEVCQVDVFCEGGVVSRIKGKGVNAYDLNGQKLSLDRGVHTPEVVKKVLNLGMDNFQQQADPAYWLTLNSGQAASVLNDIFNLSAIDLATSNIAGELRKARATAAESKERIEAATKIKEELDWTVAASKDLKELEAMEKEIGVEFVRICELEQKAAYMREARGNETRIKKSLQLAQAALKIGEEVEALHDQDVDLRGLIELKERERELAKTLLSKETQLKKWLKDQCPLCGRSN